ARCLRGTTSHCEVPISITRHLQFSANRFHIDVHSRWDVSAYKLSSCIAHLQDFCCVLRHSADRWLLLECVTKLGITAESHIGAHKAMDRDVRILERCVRSATTSICRRGAQHFACFDLLKKRKYSGAVGAHCEHESVDKARAGEENDAYRTRNSHMLLVDSRAVSAGVHLSATLPLL
ncbi:hypothetical protein OSTOST_24059, partial [Ostertagia ostertagi]